MADQSKFLQERLAFEKSILSVVEAQTKALKAQMGMMGALRDAITPSEKVNDLLQRRKKSRFNEKLVGLALLKPRKLFLKLVSSTQLLFVLIKAYSSATKNNYISFYNTNSWGFFEKHSSAKEFKFLH